MSRPFYTEQVDEDSSTRTCRGCGDSFTWSGYDEQLFVWEKRHRNHRPGKPVRRRKPRGVLLKELAAASRHLRLAAVELARRVPSMSQEASLLANRVDDIASGEDDLPLG